MTANELDQLILLASQGDMPALESLYQEMKDLVYALSLSITRRPSCAEDITQETFVRLSQSSGFTPRGQGKAWVLRIARNLALRQLQQEKRLHAPQRDRDSRSGSWGEETSLDRIMLRQALMTLGVAERQIVLLHAAGLKHEETARILRRPAGTIRWKYAQAIKKLTRFLTCTEKGDTHE
ncbi:MAG: RNA polymerase sigma factor [Clostridiales bacterium]|jgi:RNA polymerase sigma-70 factor (ECF subfamily)|nr:RNA polymerase sigma factor [Clostridiales bacterium]